MREATDVEVGVVTEKAAGLLGDLVVERIGCDRNDDVGSHGGPFDGSGRTKVWVHQR